MREIKCPACGHDLDARQMNVDQGVALCAACGKLTRLIDLLPPDESPEAEAAAPPADLTRLPAGCTVQGGPLSLRVTFNLRSWFAALFALIFAAFWNGIVSVFLVVVVGSLLTRLGVPVPIKGADIPWPVAVFVLLFLTPFIAVGVGAILVVMTALIGQVKLDVTGRQMRVRRRHRLWRRVQTFHLDEVVQVTMDAASTRFTPNLQAQTSSRPDKPPQVNVLAVHTTGQVVRFGQELTREQRLWLRTLLETLAFTPNDSVLGDLSAGQDVFANR